MTYRTIYPTSGQDNRWLFRVWAPAAGRVNLVIHPGNRLEKMVKTDFGYWESRVDGLEPGTRYTYEIDESGSFPDPASLSQPEGVHGPSELVRLGAFDWNDGEWTNIPLPEMIVYELHTGTFSPKGNFQGISDRIDYLLDLGINTIELMPVAQFSGKRNWGYDGVYPFAVHDSYGGAEGLMQLVDTCHRKGMAVVLDVVYNHFGPEGNYLAQYGPYFSEKYSTPWGKPVNFDGPHSDAVRNLIVQNALMWCRDFHIDGLRLDAVHAIFDFSARHILRELAENLNQLDRMTGKDHYLIAESNLNDVRHISSVDRGGYGLDAQWSDDFHHAVHALTTGEKNGYYVDYGEPSQLVKAIGEGFVYDGTYSEFRKKSYGSSSADRTGEQLVVFSQNHDQAGNRKHGERLIALAGFEMAKVAAGTTILVPYVPMLFMGEEYGERNPFLYFVSHLDEELNRLVKEGRQKEFEAFHGEDGPAPDPASPETFERSLLSWNVRDDKEKSAMLGFYRALIGLRRNHPALRRPDKKNLNIYEVHRVFVLERWKEDKRIFACMNYSENDQGVSVPPGVKGKLEKAIDSSSRQWNGSGEISPDVLTASDQFAIPAKSIVIYSNHTL